MYMILHISEYILIKLIAYLTDFPFKYREVLKFRLRNSE